MNGRAKICKTNRAVRESRALSANLWYAFYKCMFVSCKMTFWLKLCLPYLLAKGRVLPRRSISLHFMFWTSLCKYHFHRYCDDREGLQFHELFNYLVMNCIMFLYAKMQLTVGSQSFYLPFVPILKCVDRFPWNLGALCTTVLMKYYFIFEGFHDLQTANLNFLNLNVLE